MNDETIEFPLPEPQVDDIEAFFAEASIDASKSQEIAFLRRQYNTLITRLNGIDSMQAKILNSILDLTNSLQERKPASPEAPSMNFAGIGLLKAGEMTLEQIDAELKSIRLRSNVLRATKCKKF